MIQVFYINLGRHSVRNSHIATALARLGIKGRRISAVDGRDLDPSFIDAFNTEHNPRYKMTPGEIGCFLSHLACWGEILKSGEKYALILEDDAVFGQSLPDFTGSLGWIPEDAGIVRIETDFSRAILAFKAEGRAFGRHLHRLIDGPKGTAGYVLSAAAIPRLLSLAEFHKLPIDEFLFNPAFPACRNTRIYQLVPALVIQHGAQNPSGDLTELSSSMTEERKDLDRFQQNYLLRKLTNPFDKLFKKIRKIHGIATKTEMQIKVPFQE